MGVLWTISATINPQFNTVFTGIKRPRDFSSTEYLNAGWIGFEKLLLKPFHSPAKTLPAKDFFFISYSLGKLLQGGGRNGWRLRLAAAFPAWQESSKLSEVMRSRPAKRHQQVKRIGADFEFFGSAISRFTSLSRRFSRIKKKLTKAGKKPALPANNHINWAFILDSALARAASCCSFGLPESSFLRKNALASRRALPICSVWKTS